MVIREDGKVGIGTSDPGAKLHVKRSSSESALRCLQPKQVNI